MLLSSGMNSVLLHAGQQRQWVQVVKVMNVVDAQDYHPSCCDLFLYILNE